MNNENHKTAAPLHQVVGRLDWLPGETAPRDGTEILLRTNTGVVSAWFDYRESTPGIDDDGHYEWVCFDDKFTIDGETIILGWMPLPPNTVLGGSEQPEPNRAADVRTGEINQ